MKIRAFIPELLLVVLVSLQLFFLVVVAPAWAVQLATDYNMLPESVSAYLFLGISYLACLVLGIWSMADKLGKPKALKSWKDFQIKLFGWHRYRVKFIYKNRRGRELFNYTTTIGVRDKQTIDKHRRIKASQTPLHKMQGIDKRSLCNGTMEFEPVCFLGRWRD